jgi:hypothetical protein
MAIIERRGKAKDESKKRTLVSDVQVGSQGHVHIPKGCSSLNLDLVMI